MEKWKPVVGEEGVYEVSSLGRVRSLDREVRTRWIKGKVLTVREHGRLPAVTLSNRVKLVVSLVVSAFHLNGEKRQFNRYGVVYKDGNRFNVRVSNIRLVTKAYSNRVNSKLTTAQVCRIRKSLSKFANIRSREGRKACHQLGARYRVSYNTIRDAYLRTWGWLTSPGHIPKV